METAVCARPKQIELLKLIKCYTCRDTGASVFSSLHQVYDIIEIKYFLRLNLVPRQIQRSHRQTQRIPNLLLLLTKPTEIIRSLPQLRGM